MKILLRNDRGFSLLEVLIAIMILSVGILATTKLQLVFMQGNTKANIITQGTARAQEKIEEILSNPYDDGPVITNGPLDDRTGDGVAGLDNVGTNADSKDESDPKYKFYWNVAIDQPDAGIKTVKMIVQWQDERNVQRQVAYICYRVDI